MFDFKGPDAGWVAPSANLSRTPHRTHCTATMYTFSASMLPVTDSEVATKTTLTFDLVADQLLMRRHGPVVDARDFERASDNDSQVHP